MPFIRQIVYLYPKSAIFNSKQLDIVLVPPKEDQINKLSQNIRPNRSVAIMKPEKIKHKSHEAINLAMST
jgi:hypothetical protein